ncbi:MAG: HlyD family efflux transporter periplasmic adaptor subunit [Chloroflexi bacterium]|nr:HlyD family efflux transporter periplasmic adaptor subunit [Chloroflexota bacterium]
MSKISTKLLIVLFTCALIVSGIGCSSKPDSQEPKGRIITVQRGNLAVTVPVDGSLVMPQAFDLTFGAPGDVKDVYVEEGDFVRAGTILATLDDTAQRLDVRSANNTVQQTLSYLYETVPLLPQFPANDPNDNSGVGYPFYYPNATALSSLIWAQDEIFKARELFQAGKYSEAASELYVALSDLEPCVKILEDTINNPKSGLGNMAPFVPSDEAGITYFQIYQGQSFAVSYIIELRQAVDLIKQGQADIDKLRELIGQGKTDEAGTLFKVLLSRVDDIGKTVKNNINMIKTHIDTTIYGEAISLYFYGAAEENLDTALKGIERGDLNSSELHDNLRIAQHYMKLCNAILGSNDLVFQHGLSLQKEHGYKLDLQKDLVSLVNSEEDFLKTVIMAPFDGTVVSVDVKKNDVLSAQDYSSKGTIQLVDTTAIKFQGLVDEIDILKIETGQKATISVDAVSDRTFPGTVSFISPYASTDTGSVVKFAVTILLDPTDVELKGSLTATADIIVKNIENVLLLPVSAITTTSAGSFVDFINSATGQVEKRKVTLGSQSYQFAEILTGLNEGDEVVVQEKVTGAPITTGFPRRSQGPPPR